MYGEVGVPERYVYEPRLNGRNEGKIRQEIPNAPTGAGEGEGLEK